MGIDYKGVLRELLGDDETVLYLDCENFFLIL